MIEVFTILQLQTITLLSMRQNNLILTILDVQIRAGIKYKPSV